MWQRVVTMAALFLGTGLAGCLGGAHTPACGGEPVDHEGIRFAWPPHMATDMEPLESAFCLAQRTGFDMDLIIVEGESEVRVEHPGDGIVRIVTEPAGTAVGSFTAPYEQAFTQGTCSSVRPADQPNATWTTTCGEPNLNHLVVDWRNRPNALVVAEHRVLWVLAPGEMAADSTPIDMAYRLMDRIGIARFNGTAHESAGLNTTILVAPDDLFTTETRDGRQTNASRAAAMERVKLACADCESYSTFPSQDPRASSERLEWVVDPDGDVAWVMVDKRLAWNEMSALSIADRDRHIEALAEAQGMYLMHEPSKAMILEGPPWRLYWKVDFRYHDDDPDDDRERVVIMQLDGVTGNWTTELDGEFITTGSNTTGNEASG